MMKNVLNKNDIFSKGAKFLNFMPLIKSRNFTVVSHNSGTPNSDTCKSLKYKSATSTRHFKANSSLPHVTDLC